jgi:predicted ABC-type ATPase
LFLKKLSLLRDQTALGKQHSLRLFYRMKRKLFILLMRFILLSSPDLAVSRVAERVEQGGHNIPEDTIRRRFKAGLLNLEKYQKAVNSWVIFDGDVNPPKSLGTS